jgi:hypothetical protein
VVLPESTPGILAILVLAAATTCCVWREAVSFDLWSPSFHNAHRKAPQIAGLFLFPGCKTTGLAVSLLSLEEGEVDLESFSVRIEMVPTSCADILLL